MNSPDPSDHWKSLADEMNVEESGTPSQPVDKPADAESPKEPPPPAPKAKRVSKSWAPGNWNELANELGIEVPPEPITTKAPEAANRAGVQRSEPSVEVEFGKSESTPSDMEPTGDESAHDELPNAGSADTAGVDGGIAFFEPDSVHEIDTADVVLEGEPVASREGVQQEFRETEAEAREESDEATSPQRERSKRRRRRGRRGSSSEQRVDERDSRASQSEEQTVENEAGGDEARQTDEEPINKQDGAVETDGSAEEVEETPRRPRRRRRRRPARRDGESGASESREEEASVTDASGDEADANEKSTSDEKTGTRTKHRKIPTWEDTIATIVETNLQSRSNSGAPKGGSRGSRRRGRGSGNKRS